MIWVAPTSEDILAEFTPDEAELLQHLQGCTDNLPGIVERVVAEVRDAIASGGYELDSDPTRVPPGLVNAVIAMARWRWLCSLPGGAATLQTEGREGLNKEAVEKLKLIARGVGFAPAAPATSDIGRQGRWGGENKLLMRTHPVPRPGNQFPATPGDYASDGPPEDAQ